MTLRLLFFIIAVVLFLVAMVLGLANNLTAHAPKERQMTTVSPTQFSKPPPAGWLPLVLHAVVAGVGAVLAFMGALGTVTGSAPRVVAIGAGAVIFLGAFLGYLTAHSKAAAADEARATAWAHAHMPDAVAAYKIAQDTFTLLPPNLKESLAGAVSVAAAARADAANALALAQQTQPSTEEVVNQVLTRIASGAQMATPPTVTVAPAPAPPPAA